MIVSRKRDLNSILSVNGKNPERVWQYRFLQLSNWANDAWGSDQEIKAQIEIEIERFS